MKELRIATTLEEALALIAEGYQPVAGGTDLVVAARGGNSELPDHVVAIDRLAELSEINSSTGGLQIGATVSHARLMSDESVVDGFTALADAAALVGSPATRNVGTIGGNVMNASPAMDTGSPLVVLDAEIVLRSARGERLVPVSDFWTGPGQTASEPDELCTAVAIPNLPSDSGSAYVRLEYRRAMEIAVVGAGAVVSLDPDGDGRVVGASLALTAVAPTVIAVHGIADALIGRLIDESALADVAALAGDQASPISDLRASNDYRRHTVGVMARRAVEAASRRATGESILVPVNRSIGIGAVT